MRRGNWSLGRLCHFSKLSNETRAFLAALPGLRTQRVSPISLNFTEKYFTININNQLTPVITEGALFKRRQKAGGTFQCRALAAHWNCSSASQRQVTEKPEGGASAEFKEAYAGLVPTWELSSSVKGQKGKTISGPGFVNLLSGTG